MDVDVPVNKKAKRRTIREKRRPPGAPSTSAATGGGDETKGYRRRRARFASQWSEANGPRAAVRGSPRNARPVEKPAMTKATAKSIVATADRRASAKSPLSRNEAQLELNPCPNWRSRA
jgi:hypothetical protein